MNFIKQIITAVDNYQRRHTALGFMYAIVKKYGQDNGSYQSSIITYYALLSLFPLLIVFTTVSQLVLRTHHSLHAKVISGLNRYFPIIGNQLQESVHSPKKAGIALVISLLITLYGARGVASAVQFSINSLWHVPPTKQPSFPKNTIRAFGIIFTAGAGFIVAAVLAGYTAILGHSIEVKVLSTIISMFILWGTFIFLFKLALTGNKPVRSVAVGAGFVAIGIQLLQTLGSTILAHELKSLSNMSDTFALVIALMFWIYLQAEIILYGVEIDVIRHRHLYPRSLQPPLTDADKQAYTSYAQGRRLTSGESVKVKFHKDKSNS
jgi:membrane protein